MSSSNIALYGMMGVGKSTVGRMLAGQLGRAIADTDDEIVRWQGRTIPDIFAEEGEVAFRRYESTVVRELATYHDLVIALGGGAVLSDANVADLALTSVLIELRADVDVLVERLRAEADHRPLISGDDVDARIRRTHAERAARYAEVADVTIDANVPPDQVVEQILDWLREHQDVLTPSEYEAIMR
jgi:shikimate kinase